MMRKNKLTYTILFQFYSVLILFLFSILIINLFSLLGQKKKMIFVVSYLFDFFY